ESRTVVERAGAALLREILKKSSPRVPGEVKEDGSGVSAGWVYFQEAGMAIRRRYRLDFVTDGSGTLAVLSLEEERKNGDWQRVIPPDTTYQAFFRRLQNKIRKLR